MGRYERRFCWIMVITDKKGVSREEIIEDLEDADIKVGQYERDPEIKDVYITYGSREFWCVK